MKNSKQRIYEGRKSDTTCSNCYHFEELPEKAHDGTTLCGYCHLLGVHVMPKWLKCRDYRGDTSK